MSTILQFLTTTIVPYPKSVLLFSISIIYACWVLYLLFAKKLFQQKIYKAYFLFAFFILVWIWSNAWAESALFTSFGSTGLIGTYIATFLATVLALSTFFYISALMKNPSSKAYFWEKIFIGFMIMQGLFFAFFPEFTIKSAEVFKDGSFELIQTKTISILHTFNIIAIIWSFLNVLIALFKTNPGQIESKKFLYVCFGISIMYGSVIVFHIIFPYLFGNYSYSWIPPAFCLLEILIVGYGIFTQRFPSLKFIFANLAKLVTILIFAGVIFYLLTLKVLAGLPFFYSQTIALGIFGILVFKSARLFGSDSLQDLLIFNSVERFKREVFKLENKKIVYITLEELNDDLQKTFCKKLFISACHIIPINKIDQKHYSELIKYSAKNLQTILITKETKLQENQQKYSPKLAQELEKLGEICLPLFNPDKKLIGFFVLGHKPFHKLYTKEEIEAIQTTQCHFSTVLTSVLHSTKLQDQLEAKNQMLEKQNTEMKRLIQQQKDFINVSAHELRTPLSISHAYASILPQSEEVKNLQFGLDRLTERVNEIVYVNEHDGKQVGFNPTKVKIPDFFTQIYKNFEPTMQKKERQFNFDNKIETKTEAEFDTCKITQVIENLLSNALKFTKAEGIITLHLGIEGEKLKFAVTDNGCGVPDDTKEEIFKKFRGNHSTKDKGLGLGLYLCKKIIKMHKGKIWCEDAPLNGTTFYVTIPLKPLVATTKKTKKEG